MRRNKKQLILKFLTEKIMPNYHFVHQMVGTLLGLGEGILLDWWRDFAGLLEGSVPDGFNTLRGWFQYIAGMLSIHCRDGFILTGMVLSQLWDGFIPALGGFFQPKGC